jgi:PQQ-dependent catabolism-associated CXXCW motif protein
MTAVILRALLGFLLSFFLVVTAAAEEQGLFDPTTGYRIDRYRSPVTAKLPVGQQITLEQLDKLIASAKPVLVDVMAAEGAGPDPETGVWRLSHEHKTISGAVWLPDVGKGKLEQRLNQYFKENLAALTDNDLKRAVVIFCMADCWMSWNAVQRAVSYGYINVYWYAEGVNGWTEWEDRKLVAVSPQPVNMR